MREAGLDGQWALILGASSGFGAATALALAEAGMHICGIHLDRRATMPNVEKVVHAIEAQHHRQAIFCNVNAADEAKRQQTLDDLRRRLDDAAGPATVRVLMHSLAFGTLAPFVDREGDGRTITQRQMEMTVDVMAHSLVYWTQDMLGRGLLGSGSKIFAMTSGGDVRVIPTYGAVSAAKAALASHIRQLAVELAPRGIAANAIKAGITDTPALARIPVAEKLMRFAREHNPSGRMTTPQDIGRAIVRLSIDDSHWLTGNTINVDGAEDIIAIS